MTQSNDRDVTAVEDLKVLRNYLLGVIAFATAVTAFLTQILHFPTESTLVMTTLLGTVFLVIVFLIQRAERRTDIKLKDHIDESDVMIHEFRQDLEYIKNMTLENQRSALRTEMNTEIYRNPSNHDTIIKYAYRYFKELDSDWVETTIFEAWRKSEEEAGRPVNLPPDLLSNINAKIISEQ